MSFRLWIDYSEDTLPSHQYLLTSLYNHVQISVSCNTLCKRSKWAIDASPGIRVCDSSNNVHNGSRSDTLLCYTAAVGILVYCVYHGIRTCTTRVFYVSAFTICVQHLFSPFFPTVFVTAHFITVWKERVLHTSFIFFQVIL